MSNHLKWIKHIAKKSIQEIQAIKEAQEQETDTGKESLADFTLRDIREFTLNISRDHICTIYRCFISTEDSGELTNVGWIIDESCQFCPLCNNPFSQVFRSKHHCRRCGDIICNVCTRYGKLRGFEDLGALLMCRGCYDKKVSFSNQLNSFL